MAGRRPNADRWPTETLKGFSRARAQAHYRGEVWNLTIEDWRDFWTRERWPNRGRTAGCICLTRSDQGQPWSRSNCCLVERFAAIRAAKARQSGRPPDPAIWAGAIYLETAYERQ